MAEIIASKFGKKVKIEKPDDVEKKGYNLVTKSVLNADKLKELNWVPCWDFEEGIEETLKIMKE